MFCCAWHWTDLPAMEKVAKAIFKSAYHCVVKIFWSSGIMECTCMMFTFENGVPLMGFNKTEAAVFSCRLCFLRAFFFISFFYNLIPYINVILCFLMFKLKQNGPCSWHVYRSIVFTVSSRVLIVVDQVIKQFSNLIWNNCIL